MPGRVGCNGRMGALFLVDIKCLLSYVHETGFSRKKPPFIKLKRTMNKQSSLQQEESSINTACSAEEPTNETQAAAGKNSVCSSDAKEELKNLAKGLPLAIGKGFLLGVLDVFLPMIGTRWFWLDKKIAGIVHTVVCSIIVPLIVYSCLSRFAFAGICAFVVSWLAGWLIYRVYSFIETIMDLLDFIKVVKQGRLAVIQYVLTLLFVGGIMYMVVMVCEAIF